MSELPNVPLIRFIEKNHPTYYGRLLDLRNEVSKWLSFIPATFAHYTQHTVDHSDSIVANISQLLFKDDLDGLTTPQFSPTEAFIVVAAAYLHDSGMVVSENQKAEIIASAEWIEWTTSGTGVKRWQEIEQFNNAVSSMDAAQRAFLKNTQIRFLIAEFVRRSHHTRAARVIMELHNDLGLFALNDHMLLKTISDVCVAHGLEPKDLENRDRYPDRRTIAGELVNVQFLALLLRIGDLLDMSSHRACPMLMNVASPLPSESIAHWTQYKRITHFMIAPDAIEIKAECETQEEHRLLRDWCQWLVSEVKRAGQLMQHASRHNGWTAPKAGFENPETITIRPAHGATYKPFDWRLELDVETVFTRLIRDIYSEPLVFIRELIQNAIDATRCKMFSDLSAAGKDLPKFPTQVDEVVRDSYPIDVSICDTMVVTGLSGEEEHRQVVTISDVGVGMSESIIRRYFLQVGRSYYDTDEFKTKFGFSASSKFGVGFLSVFGASNHVEVETLSALANTGEPLKLTLTGPRNYILIEKGVRSTPGTTVSVILNETTAPEEIVDRIRYWCKRVEFPIVVRHQEDTTLITPERAEDFEFDIPVLTEEGTRFVLRVFPIERPGIEGELYVLAVATSEGEESWTRSGWANYTYPKLHPHATEPPMPQSITCLNGITVTEERYHRYWRHRLDYRRPMDITISRDDFMGQSIDPVREDPDVESRWHEVLAHHLSETSLAQGDKGWIYKQDLASDFDFPSFWRTVPNCVRLVVDGHYQMMSLDEVMLLPQIQVLITVSSVPPMLGISESFKNRHESICINGPVVLDCDILQLSGTFAAHIFQGRQVTRVDKLQDNRYLFSWSTSKDEYVRLFNGENGRWLQLVPFLPIDVIAIHGHRTIDRYTAGDIINASSLLGTWLNKIKLACVANECGLKSAILDRLGEILYSAVHYQGTSSRKALSEFLVSWNDTFGQHPNLLAPDLNL